MTKPYFAADFAHAAPLRRNRGERVFGLHPALFALTVGGYFLYLGIMAVTFMNPELILPFAIFGIIVGASFLVPGLWARIAPKTDAPVPNWSEFLREGIETHTGHLSGKGAVVQVLIMPAMLVGWGLVVALIRATV